MKELTMLENMTLGVIKMWAIKKPDKPLSMASISKKLNRSKPSIGDVLRRLRRKGYLKRIGEHGYICEDHDSWDTENDCSRNYHYTEKQIVAYLRKKKASPSLLSKKFGVHADQIREILEILEAVGMVIEHHDNKYSAV